MGRAGVSTGRGGGSEDHLLAGSQRVSREDFRSEVGNFSMDATWVQGSAWPRARAAWRPVYRGGDAGWALLSIGQQAAGHWCVLLLMPRTVNLARQCPHFHNDPGQFPAALCGVSKCQVSRGPALQSGYLSACSLHTALLPLALCRDAGSAQREGSIH